MTTHKMGRHVFGTVYAPQLPAKTLMEYMGITKFSVVQRYINFSKTEKVDQFERATQKILYSGVSQVSRSPPQLAPLLLEQLRTLAPPGRERAWLAFVDGLVGLFVEDETKGDA